MTHLGLSLATLVFALPLPGLPAMPQQKTDLTTLRTNVRLTNLDVVVTDGKGNPVTGLRQDDFTVRENKQPQSISSFEEHNGAVNTYEGTAPGVFTNATKSSAGVSNVLLIDWLNTPATDAQTVRDQVVKFLASQPPGARMAIFSMGSSVHLLQDFTDDPAALKMVLLKLGAKYSPMVTSLRATPVSGGLESAVERAASSPGGAEQQAVLAGLMQTQNDMNTREDASITRNNALITMQDLRDVARALSGVNGRKNLLWLSGAFPVFIQRDSEATGNPFVGNTVLDKELHETQNLLASAQVAIYPIDPRGVPVPPSMLPDNSPTTVDLAAQQRMNGSQSFTPGDKAYANSQQQEHAAMEELADATGGKAFFNSNGISQAMAEALASGSHFYTLSYTPPPGTKPGDFRSIAVDVKGKGLHLSYRRGYSIPAAGDGKPAQPNNAKLLRAMKPMSPQSGEVVLQLQPSVVSAADPSKTIGAAAADGKPHATYRLNAAVDPATIRFDPAGDGTMRAVIDLVTVLYDSGGKVVDSRSDRAVLALEGARYQAILAGGVRFHQDVAVPDAGEFYLRMAVYDAVADRIGTLQIRGDALRRAARQGSESPR